MPLRVVLLGPPASGKGTQGRLLAERRGLPYLSTGRQLRQEVESGTEIGRRAESFLRAGEYVPDDLALDLAARWMKQAGHGWVLDGFPRTVPQARELDAWLGPWASELVAVSLEADSRELERRVAERLECPDCGWSGRRGKVAGERCPRCASALAVRDDDELENFLSRLRAFGELTQPVAAYYQGMGRLRLVNGEGSRNEVCARVQEAVGKD